MANDLKVKITADVKGFKSDMQDAGKSMDEFTDKTNDAGQSVADYQSKLSKSEMNIRSFNKELKQAKKDALDFANAFNSLSPDQQISGFGKQLKAQLEEAIQKTGELTDLKGDIQREINNIASDTRGFDTAKESISLLMNTMGALSSAYAAITGDQEAYNRAVTIFTGTQQTLITLTAIQNALQKETNLYKVAEAAQMIIINGLRKFGIIETAKQTAATEAEAAAQAEDAAATTANAAAHKALNVAMKAGPYVIIAAAIAAIGVGIKVVTSLIDKHNKKLQEQQEAYRKATAAQRAFDQAMIDGHTSIAKEVTRLDLLQRVMRDTNRSYKDRKAAIEELNRVIPGYHASISKEGNLYNDNITAIQNYINNLDKAAKAMAGFNALVKENEKLFELQGEQTRKQGQSLAAYNRLTASGVNPLKQEIKGSWIYDRETGQAVKDATGKYIKASKQQIEDFNKWMSHNNAFKNYAKDIKEQAKNVERMSATVAKEIDVSSLISKPTSGGTKTPKSNTNNNDIKYETLQLEDLIKIREKLNEKAREYYKIGNTAKLQEYDAEIKKIDEVVKKRKELQVEYDFKYDPKYADLSKINTEPVLIPLQFDFTNVKMPDLAKLIKINQLQKQLNNIRERLAGDGFISADELKQSAEEIDKLRAKLIELYNSLPDDVKKTIKLELDESGVDATEKKLKQLQEEALSIVSSLQGPGVQIQNMFVDLGKLMGNVEATPFQKLGAAFAVTGEAAAEMGTALAELGADSALAKAGMVAAAIGQIILGFAQATAQASSMGPWGWLAFIGAGLGALATTITMIKNMQQFEHGGVVAGNSYHGDKVLARLNSGERVLTKKQNDKLNRLLDSGGLYNGNVNPIVLDTVIRSGDIWLTQRQYDKTRKINGKG